MLIELAVREIVIYFWESDGPGKAYCFDCRVKMNLLVKERSMKVCFRAEANYGFTTNDTCNGCHRTWTQVLERASANATVAFEEAREARLVATH